MRYKPMKLGSMILKCREEKKYSQSKLGEELAKRMADDPEARKFNRKTIGDWESGRTSPRANALLTLCDIFDCELGYLLEEPGYEDKTRSATDIVRETGLSGEAVHLLQEYRISASKRESDKVNKYIYTDEFIPALISFMLESEDFNRLVERICSQNRKTIEYALKSDVEKEIITEAYKNAKDQLGSESSTDIFRLREQYQTEVKNLMEEKKEEIVERFPLDMAEGFYENIFIQSIQRTFDLARHTSNEVIEMNNFLDQKDMFNIVSKFMGLITQFR